MINLIYNKLERLEMKEEEVLSELKRFHALYVEHKDIVNDFGDSEHALDVPEKMPGARTVYLAGGWWGEYQPQMLIRAYRALLMNPTVAHIHVPLLHQYGGNAFVDGEFEPDYEWATMTYKADLRGIDNTDVTVALFPVEDQDIGTATEVGYAKRGHKPVVGVFQGDAYKNPVNLMVSMSADASVTHPNALMSFDFMDIEPNMYEGRLI